MKSEAVILLVVLFSIASSNTITGKEKENAKTAVTIMRNVAKRWNDFYEASFNESLVITSDQEELPIITYDRLINLTYAFVECSAPGFDLDSKANRTEEEKVYILQSKSMSKNPPHTRYDNSVLKKDDKKSAIYLTQVIRKAVQTMEEAYEERFHQKAPTNLDFVDSTHFTDNLYNLLLEPVSQQSMASYLRERKVMNSTIAIMQNVEKRWRQIYEQNVNETVLVWNCAVSEDDRDPFTTHLMNLVYAFVESSAPGFDLETSYRHEDAYEDVRVAQNVSLRPLENNLINLDEREQEAAKNLMCRIRRMLSEWELTYEWRYFEKIPEHATYVDSTHFTDQMINVIHVYAEQTSIGKNETILYNKQFERAYLSDARILSEYEEKNS